MSEFWHIVSRWSGEGQGLFFLISGAGILFTVRACCYYAVVAMRGWPNCNCKKGTE